MPINRELVSLPAGPSLARVGAPVCAENTNALRSTPLIEPFHPPPGLSLTRTRASVRPSLEGLMLPRVTRTHAREG
jgi:hypothetical protein